MKKLVLTILALWHSYALANFITGRVTHIEAVGNRTHYEVDVDQDGIGDHIFSDIPNSDFDDLDDREADLLEKAYDNQETDVVEIRFNGTTNDVNRIRLRRARRLPDTSGR